MTSQGLDAIERAAHEAVVAGAPGYADTLEALVAALLKGAYFARSEPRQVGDVTHVEYWIPAEDLPEFNRNIQGVIRVVAEFRGPGKVDP